MSPLRPPRHDGRLRRRLPRYVVPDDVDVDGMADRVPHPHAVRPQCLPDCVQVCSDLEECGPCGESFGRDGTDHGPFPDGGTSPWLTSKGSDVGRQVSAVYVTCARLATARQTCVDACYHCASVLHDPIGVGRACYCYDYCC